MMDLFLRLFNMSVTASWLILAILVMRPLLSKAPKWIRGILWGLVGIRLMIPISFESVFSLIPTKQLIVPSEIDGVAPTFASGIHAVDVSVNAYLQEQASVEAIASARNAISLESISLGIWLLGIAGLILYSMFSYMRLRKILRDAVRYQGNIYQSDKISSPFVLGFVGPRIYIPYHLDDEALECVVTHENAHIMRKDYLIKPFSFALASIHWFNPVVWVAYYYLCQDIELACDEKVIHELGFDKKKVYSKTLLECSMERHFVRACPVAFGEIGVGKRVKNILEMKKAKVGMVVGALLVCVVVAVCFLSNPKSEKKDVAVNESTAASASQKEDENSVEATEELEALKEAEQQAKEAEEAQRQAEQAKEVEEAQKQASEKQEQAEKEKEQEEVNAAPEEEVVIGVNCMPFKDGTEYFVTAVFSPDGPENGEINVEEGQQHHLGIDFAAEAGTEIVACATGVVKEVGSDAEAGNYIVIEDEKGYVWKYMHLEAYSVKQGDNVSAGSVIGTVGSTGQSTGPHLHVETTFSNGEYVDPATLFGL